ncbi:UpxY family transcription antiterminator [Ferruginibacter sp. SUN106]|uniref:UpxY family transcription antiterminator n=1 Tax=Ferruginibacter sp. SUN106 TaxID=2978348 RepID=UPI003D369C68
MENSIYWHAVYTKPRWEKKVAALLEAKGIEYYCPLNKVTKQWSDRKKTVLEPLFKSYVFVQIAENKKWDLLNIPGILNYVTWLGKPAKIKDSEIATIRKFLKEFESVEVVEGLLEINSKVKIKQGVLMNYHGILLQISGNRASVKIESMGLQLITSIDKKNLEKVEADRT